jgi:hypothetical protein
VRGCNGWEGKEMRLGRAAVHLLLLAFWGRTLPVQVNVTGQVPNTDVTYTYSVQRVTPALDPTSGATLPTWQVCRPRHVLDGWWWYSGHLSRRFERHQFSPHSPPHSLRNPPPSSV